MLYALEMVVGTILTVAVSAVLIVGMLVFPLLIASIIVLAG